MKTLDQLIFAVPEGVPSVHIEALDGQIAPNVITGGSPGRILNWAQLLDNVEMFPIEVTHDGIIPVINYVKALSESKIIELVLGKRLQVVINGTRNGEHYTLANTFMGAPTVGINLLELVRYCNEPKMLILRGGTSGIMTPDIKVGDIIITKGREYTNDGVSADLVFDEMFPKKDYIAVPDADVAEALKAVSIQYKLGFQNVHTAMTKTVRELFRTNEKYREILSDPKLLADYQSQSGEFQMPSAISMEFAVYCAVRDLCNTPKYGHEIKVGQSLVGSDYVFKTEKPGSEREIYREHESEIEMIQGKSLMDSVPRIRHG